MPTKKTRHVNSKNVDEYSLHKLFSRQAKVYPNSNRKPFVFISITTVCSVVFLISSSLILSNVLAVKEKPLEELINEAYNVTNSRVFTTGSLPDENFALFGSSMGDNTFTYNISYETDVYNVEAFVDEIKVFVDTARQSGAKFINLTASSFRHSFHYEGEIGEEVNEDRLNVSLSTLEDFSKTPLVGSVGVSSVTPSEGEKPVIEVETVRSLVSSANIISHMPTLLENRFTSDSWFQRYDFRMTVVSGVNRENHPPIQVTTLLSSVEDVEAAKTIDVNVYYNLYELTQIKWVNPAREIIFFHEKPFEKSILQIIADSTENNEAFEKQMYRHWMTSNPILRPQPYVVYVWYDAPNTELAFGVGR